MQTTFIIKKRVELLGWASNSRVFINLHKADTTNEILDTLTHEALHLVLSNTAKTTEAQDHYIFKHIQTDWF